MKLLKPSAIVAFCIIYFIACKKDAPVATTLKPVGNFLWDYKRWNSDDSLSSLDSSTCLFGENVVFNAENSSSDSFKVEVASGYYYKPRYILQFVDAGNNFYKLSSVSFNQDDIESSFIANGVTITGGPNILINDDVHEIYEIQYTVSSSGSPRYIIDKYYRQQ